MVGNYIRKWCLVSAGIIFVLPLLASALLSAPARAQNNWDEAEAKKWFVQEEIKPNPVGIAISEEQTPPPTITIEPQGQRTKKVVFVLTHVQSEGSGSIWNFVGPQAIIGIFSQYANKDWLIFAAHLDTAQGPVLPDTYLLVNDSQGEAIVYDTDHSGVFKGKFSALTNDFDVKDDDIGRLFGYLMNAPADPTHNDENCANVSGYATTEFPKGLYETGPDIKGEKKTLGSYGFSGEKAREMNGNCLNQDPTGWAAHWGVTTKSIPSDYASGCSIGALIKGTVGETLVNVIACTVQFLYEKVIVTGIGLTQSIGGQNDSLEAELSKSNEPLVEAWRLSLGIVNIVVIIALLAIAFANILHLNINTYAAKKALPGLALGVVGANASLLLIRFLLDVAQALMSFGYQIAGVTKLPDLIHKLVTVLGDVGTSHTVALIFLSPFALFIIIVFVVYFFFLLVIFCWAMVKRLVFLYGLTILAPLAFIAYGVPSMQQWFGKWWDQFIRHLFSLPIIIIAIALLVKYAVALGFSANFDAVAKGDAKGIFSTILIFAATAFILKIPGLVTKGALDITEHAKKAFGYAKGVPANMYGGLQGGAKGLEKLRGAKAAAMSKQGEALRMRANRLQASGDIAGARRLRAEALTKYQQSSRLNKAAGKWKDTGNFFGSRRGYAYSFANPDKTIKPWWEARTKEAEKGSSIESSKINVGIPGKKSPKWNFSDVVSGRMGGYASKAKDARERMKDDAASVEEAYDAAEASQGMIKAVEKHVSTMTPLEAMRFRSRVAGAKKADKMSKILEEIVAANPNANIKGKGLYAEGTLSAFYDYAIRQAKQQRGRAAGAANTQNANFATWLGGSTGGGTPYGTAGGPPGTPGAAPYGEVDPERIKEALAAQMVMIDARQQEVMNLVGHVKPAGSPDQATAVNPDGTTEFVPQANHFQNMADRYDDALASDDAEMAQAVSDLRTETISTIRQSLIGNVEEISAELATELQQLEAEDLSDPLKAQEVGARLRELSENFHLASEVQARSGNVEESVRQLLGEQARLNTAAAEVSQQATGQLNTLNEQQLAQLLSGSIDEIGNQLEEVIRPAVDKMAEAIGRQDDAAAKTVMQTRTLQEIKSALNGRDRYSLATVMRQRFNQLGETILKTSRDLPPPGPTNVTVENKINQATQSPVNQTTVNQVTEVTSTPPTTSSSPLSHSVPFTPSAPPNAPVVTAPEAAPPEPPAAETPLPPSPEVSPNLPPDTQP